MTPRLSLRLAAASLAVFALGHTVGGMLLAAPRGPEEEAVLGALARYRFDIMGFNRSHGEFYEGEGWYLSLAIVLFAILCWQLGDLAASHPSVVRGLLVIPAAFCLVSVVLCLLFFFTAPLVTSALALLAIAVAWSKLPRAA